MSSEGSELKAGHPPAGIMKVYGPLSTDYPLCAMLNTQFVDIIVISQAVCEHLLG